MHFAILLYLRVLFPSSNTMARKIWATYTPGQVKVTHLNLKSKNIMLYVIKRWTTH